MAEPTTVNSQITDSVTQSNVKVLADAPAVSMGQLYQSIAHSLGLAAENAVANQQSMNNISNASVAASLQSLIGEVETETKTTKTKN